MLDITSYRRKQKYVQPLTIMREFYYDYSKSSRNPLKSPVINKIESDPLFRRTLSVEKFNKSLSGLQALTDRNTNQKQHKRESSTNYLTKEESSTQKILKKESGNFKQNFSSTVAILKGHWGIKCPTEPFQLGQDNKYQKCQINNIFYKKGRMNNKNATKLFQEMCQQKQIMERIKSIKNQKSRQIRQNSIINNSYLNHQTFQTRTTNKIKIRCRARDRFQTTKQNIFPTTSSS